MKKLYALLIFIISISNVTAQCVGGNRYITKMFEYDSIVNVKYGANVTASSSTPANLLYDIYLPKGDTLTTRPVIFFTHGGSFLFGSKLDGDVVSLCREFAKRGYVTVSQDYRLGFESFDATSATRAVWRAMQDGRAAVRHVRSKASEYKIDTNMIIYGGSSAGAFTALHVAFLDEPQEILPGMDTSAYVAPNGTGLGNFHGTTNNLTNSSKVNAVINLCGAIGDTAWIQNKDSNIAIMSMHGTFDNTVPYGSAIIKLLGSIPLLTVDGSASIREHLNNKGWMNRFYTYCGQDHVPYAGSSVAQKQWMDSTVAFISQFIYKDVFHCNGTSLPVMFDIDSTDCPVTGIYSNHIEHLKIYPNPANTTVSITLNNPNDLIKQIEVYDYNGRKVISNNINQLNNINLNLVDLANGIYLIKVSAGDNTYIQKIIKE